MPDFGGTETVAAQSLTQTAQEKLRQLVARIEKLEEEKASENDSKDEDENADEDSADEENSENDTVEHIDPAAMTLGFDAVGALLLELDRTLE